MKKEASKYNSLFRSFLSHAATLTLSALLLSASCGPSSGNTNEIDGGTNPNPDADLNICQNNESSIVCDGNQMVTCGEGGQEISRQDCGTLNCLEGKGCVLCYHGDAYCQDDTVMVCSQDMMSWEQGNICDPNNGEVCDPDEGACVNLCDQAADRKANVGCDYLAVDMANVDEYSANDGCFVVIVSNVQPEGTAVITVEDEAGNLLDFPGHGTERQLAPGELAILAISGDAGHCSQTPAVPNTVTMASGLQPGSVYRVRSTLPVVAYQINPYEAANKHTTDASLLIPQPAYGDQYLTANYTGLPLGQTSYSSSISIVAAQDNTTVTISPSVAVQGGGPVPVGSGPFDVTLNAMEHLQVLAQGDGDLTSSLITADAPVAVFSGVLCANVPPSMGYCDHLEEQLPPVKSWGWTYIAAFPPRRSAENTLWRIVAALDNTQVYFEPLSQYDTVLSSGDMLEIDADRSFLVYSMSNVPDSTEDPPILLMNYLKGSEQTAQESGTTIEGLGNVRGDPAMTLSVPVEQYLNSYIFLADPSYAYNYVVVVRTDPNQSIHLGCMDPIPANYFEPISGDYSRAVVVLSAEDGSADGTCASITNGVHDIWSDIPFGIWVYGYYSDTSYGYPGGMNLEQINDVVIVE